MYYYHVTGTVIAPNPFMGETRLWVNQTVGPAWTHDHAAEIALALVCRAEELNPIDVMWGSDIKVTETQPRTRWM